MATFIEIRTDAFAKNLQNATTSSMASPAVRRPLRGIEIKPDRYATIMIKQANGVPIALTDAGSRSGSNSGQSTSAGGGVDTGENVPKAASSYIYSNFIVESIEDSRQEKVQIMETFGEPYAFFFGERPRTLNVSGLLFNTRDFNWRSEFWYNYENKIRGTKLVERNARLYLHWDDIIVEGYPIGAMASESADMPYTVRFSFTLFVTNHTFLSQIGSDDYPVSSYVNKNYFQEDIVDPSFKDTLVNGKASAAGARQLAGLAVGTGVALTATAFSAGLGQTSNTKAKNLSYKIMRDAIAVGLKSSTLTFMQVVEEYFKGKRVANPKRVLPLRSKIRDNFDEYVTDGDGGVGGSMAPFDMDYIKYIQEKQEKARSWEETTATIHRGLVAAGTNPVKVTVDAVKYPFNYQNAVTMATDQGTASLSDWGMSLVEGR